VSKPSREPIPIGFQIQNQFQLLGFGFQTFILGYLTVYPKGLVWGNGFGSEFLNGKYLLEFVVFKIKNENNHGAKHSTQTLQWNLFPMQEAAKIGFLL